MKEVIGKERGTFDTFPKKKMIINKVEIIDTETVARTFNTLFVKIKPNLALNISKSNANFEA